MPPEDRASLKESLECCLESLRSEHISAEDGPRHAMRSCPHGARICCFGFRLIAYQLSVGGTGLFPGGVMPTLAALIEIPGGAGSELVLMDRRTCPWVALWVALRAHRRFAECRRNSNCECRRVDRKEAQVKQSMNICTQQKPVAFVVCRFPSIGNYARLASRASTASHPVIAQRPSYKPNNNCRERGRPQRLTT
jgi:hypothetical protein